MMEIVEPKKTMPTVLCCICGAAMKPNAANTCAECLKTEHDITKDILKEIILFRCRNCGKFQRDSAAWTSPFLGLESKELLSLCLKRLKGFNSKMSKVNLCDARFLFTEPHSMRLKIELTVEKEVVSNVTLRQSCIVSYIIRNKMCSNCHKVEAKRTWTAVCQVRQKAAHKKTFLYLEQLILKHGQYKKAVNIEESRPYGMDFFFNHLNDAQGFLSFIESVVPVKKKQAKKLISQDFKANVADYQYTLYCEIASVCKDDFVILPRDSARKSGNISQMALCIGVNSNLRFIDPFTCQLAEVDSTTYWKTPFNAQLSAKRLKQFIVLDIRNIDYQSYLNNKGNVQKNLSLVSNSTKKNKTKSKRKRRKNVAYSEELMFNQYMENMQNEGKKKWKLVEVEVAKESDFGVNDKKYICNSHLGISLKVGDTVLGYDLTTVTLNLDENDNNYKNVKEDDLPDIVLVKKHYPKFRKASKNKRNWKLKKLQTATKTENEENEEFMNDIEEDEDLQKNIDLYKSQTESEEKKKNDIEVEDDAPVVRVENLLEELDIQ